MSSKGFRDFVLRSGSIVTNGDFLYRVILPNKANLWEKLNLFVISESPRLGYPRGYPSRTPPARGILADTTPFYLQYFYFFLSGGTNGGGAT